MSVAFHQGDTTGQGDLSISLANASGYASNAYEINYAIFYVDPTPPNVEILIGPAVRTPVNPSVGEYYAALAIPSSASAGTYRIRWTFRDMAGAPQQMAVMEFAVVGLASTTTSSPYSVQELQMIQSLRILLRDNNPSKFYHFRPPEYEGRIGQYNQVFGQVWEDAELYEYLQRGLDWCNMLPPRTDSLNSLTKLVTEKPSWRTAVLWAAITHACFALAANWCVDEFSYSIGGVSLDLQRSDKYQSLKQNADTALEKFSDTKVRTTKIARGLTQPRMGVGIKSSLGGAVGRGILSPRSFV